MDVQCDVQYVADVIGSCCVHLLSHRIKTNVMGGILVEIITITTLVNLLL